MSYHNEALDAIFERKSVRKFIDKKIENDKLELLLKAGMAAPSALNHQPWKFILVDDRKLLDQLADKLPYAKMLSSAKAAILVCGDIEKALQDWEQDFWIQDCSAATENILVAAQALGLGAVWTALYPSIDRVNIARVILNIPENIMPLNVIPIGYPTGKEKPIDKWDASNIHYNSWD